MGYRIFFPEKNAICKSFVSGILYALFWRISRILVCDCESAWRSHAGEVHLCVFHRRLMNHFSGDFYMEHARRPVTESCLIIFTMLVGTLLAGCDGKGSKSNKDTATDSATSSDGDSLDGVGSDSTILPGETGAACVVETDCVSPLSCIASKCQPVGCESGLLGCACGNGGACGASSSGIALQCVAGACVYPDCSATGQTGCPCLHNEICANPTDVCEDGVCFAGECIVGQSGCACNGGTCADGLMCKDGAVCTDATGFPGGFCLANSACYAGARCDTVNGNCVACAPGSVGCQCAFNNACDGDMSCMAGICVTPDMVPPENPKCYTPCLSDLVSETELRTCSADGLLDGCISDFQCADGSCLKEGEQKPVCSNDLDCPFFQTCLMGKCYANCETNSDCATGLGCHNRVCRVPCRTSAGAAPCPGGMSCDTLDGENGYCISVAPPSTTTQLLPTGGFTLSRAMLSFTNISVTDDFQILSDSEFKQQFTVRKLRHTLHMADGTVERVEATKDPVTGEYTECNAVAGECPLFWLDMITGDNSTRDAILNATALPNCTEDNCPTIQIANAGGSPGVRWEGDLEITSPNGRATITLSYVERPEGQWIGTMYYFGNFSDAGFDKWRARADLSDVSDVSNGLIQRWGALRAGSMTDGWEEFKAVLTATRTGSWKFGEVIKKCEAVNGAGTRAACYPFSNTAGVRTYVNDTNTLSIPTGLSEFGIGMNLRLSSAEGTFLEGRIESSIAMHYAGNPAVTLSFEKDPSASDACDPRVATDCLVYLKDMEAEITVGGRYLTDETADCGPGYTKVKFPWLVREFKAHTAQDPETNQLYRYECMDNELPFDVAQDADLLSTNISLAQANPVPDGLPRPRSLQLIDGALVNQTDLFILFKEHFDSFVGGTTEATGDKGISAYGYMILKKQPVDLSTKDENGDGISDAFQGNVPPAKWAKSPDSKLGVTCDAGLLLEMAGVDEVDTDNADSVVATLLDGSAPMPQENEDGSVTNPDPLISDSSNPAVKVHYLCEDTGIFDGGYGDDGSDGAFRIRCPEGSKVTWFVVKEGSNITQASIAQESCHSEEQLSCETVAVPSNCEEETCPAEEYILSCTNGTCDQVLKNWVAAGTKIESWEPYISETGSLAGSSANELLDLRAGKLFYEIKDTEHPFLSLKTEIESAFRYKTRFKSRTGAQVGFAPEICVPNSDQIPYCYEPDEIENIRKRVDCLVSIYSNDELYGSLTTGENSIQSKLNAFLRESYSKQANMTIGGREGFEKLYAELMIMLGDESLTSAFGSRFDLAGANGASFEGDLFEENGIKLDGIAGFEMYRLYQAMQYYQLVLDRLFFAGPNFTHALLRNESTVTETNIVSPEIVVEYLDRLIRASTQKARTISEISKSYQYFNMPDLARRVIERAYTATYLESIILSRLMTNISEKSSSQYKPQIEKTIENGQRAYRMALLDMKDVYGAITDDINYFGFAPDYVPFPALDTSRVVDVNAFDMLMETALTKTGVAKQREQAALESNRSYNTDAASFQAELVKIRNNYEAQLGDICGTFEGVDGQIYPAIRKYADMNEFAALFGDPCGLMNSGQIYSSFVELQSSTLQQEIYMTQFRNIYEMIDVEVETAKKQCDVIHGIADYQYNSTSNISDLEEDIEKADERKEQLIAAINARSSIARAATCVFSMMDGGASCLNLKKDVLIDIAAEAAIVGIGEWAKNKIEAKEDEIASIQIETARWITNQECERLKIDSNARMAERILQLKEIELENERANKQTHAISFKITELVNEGKRLQSEQEETEQLLINVESAKNDPNVRIYKNDAIINADIAFNDAIRAAYRATRVFEYYTSQTYARKDQLFLIRMVGSGDYNLENYLMQLENEYYDFQEQFGNPDVRVAVLSLRDDILNIPILDNEANPLSQEQRITMMREKLAKVELLDANGHLALPFSTRIDELSPLTVNHKIVYVEADIVGSDVGDTLGRLYLRQSGTGVIRNVSDETDYFVFPEHTAVIDPYFNGTKLLSPEVYRSYRFMDRPMVNTFWEMLINQRDEQVNKDINLQSLTDIRLYVYYTDFTLF